VHWASDVVGGWLIGTMWLAICLTVARVAALRRPVTTGPGAPVGRSALTQGKEIPSV
jgi:membrane-associated phospholipid phosphatase